MYSIEYKSILHIMAAIDRIYLTHSWQYDEFRKWCEEQPLLTDKHGKNESISNYLYRYDAGTWHNERPVFSAPYYVDAYVIRNCPFDYVQKELMINYGDSYEKIKEGKLYTSPKTDKVYTEGRHFKCVKHPVRYYNRPFECKRWFVDIELPSGSGFMWYNGESDTWDFHDEYVIGGWKSSCAFVSTIKSLKRKIIKWKLPVGTKIIVTGRYVADEYQFIIKK